MRAKRNQSERNRWLKGKHKLGTKTLLCRGCGRKVEMETATVLRMNADRKPIDCKECGKTMAVV
jgi:hypothetical protein